MPIMMSVTERGHKLHPVIAVLCQNAFKQDGFIIKKKRKKKKDHFSFFSSAHTDNISVRR